MAHTLTGRLLRYVSVPRAFQGCVSLRKKKKEEKTQWHETQRIVDHCFQVPFFKQKKVMKKLFSNEMIKEGPDMLKTKEHRQFRWSRCMRTGKKQSACRRTWRCLWTRKANKCCRYPGVAPACTWLSLLWRIERGRSGCTAKAWAGEHWCCRDTGGWNTFASTMGRQVVIQTEHLDSIFRMTSTLQPSSARGRFSAFLFFHENRANNQLILLWRGSSLTRQLQIFCTTFIKISIFSIHLVTKPPCLSKEVPKHVQDDRTYW